MKRFALTFILIGISTALLLWKLDEGKPFDRDYATTIRAPVFSALLTVGSFLLTLKTAILQRLKEGFDSAAHRENYLLFKKKNPDAEYYSSLRNMSVALSACIVLAFLGAAAQFSLGFVCHPIATAICLTAGITTLIMLIYLWMQIAGAHRLWLDGIEDAKQKELSTTN